MSCLTYYLHFNLISYKLDVCCIFFFFGGGVTLTFEHMGVTSGFILSTNLSEASLPVYRQRTQICCLYIWLESQRWWKGYMRNSFWDFVDFSVWAKKNIYTSAWITIYMSIKQGKLKLIWILLWCVELK